MLISFFILPLFVVSIPIGYGSCFKSQNRDGECDTLNESKTSSSYNSSFKFNGDLDLIPNQREQIPSDHSDPHAHAHYDIPHSHPKRKRFLNKRNEEIPKLIKNSIQDSLKQIMKHSSPDSPLFLNSFHSRQSSHSSSEHSSSKHSSLDHSSKDSSNSDVFEEISSGKNPLNSSKKRKLAITSFKRLHPESLKRSKASWNLVQLEQEAINKVTLKRDPLNDLKIE